MTDLSNRYIIHKKNGDLEYIQFRHFNETGLVKHCFTMRRGGTSVGDFDSLNLGYNTPDNRENIEENRRIIAKEIGVEGERLVKRNHLQPHGDQIVICDSQNLETFFEVDGFMTEHPDIPLITCHADCVSVLFLDPKKRIIANSHAGWRGTVEKIGQKTVLKMVHEFGCSPEDILVGIGPSIGQCCFETDSPVVEKFDESFGIDNGLYYKEGDKFHVDLWKANSMQLEEVGIRPENIYTSGICTVCNKDRFFSHRGDCGKTGRMGAIIELV